MALRAATPLMRDAGGVVHIRASGEPDLYRRLAYCHGHDRALQILLMRIVVSGRACELLRDDDQMLALDRFVRRAGLACAVEERPPSRRPGTASLPALTARE
jgi:penicillin G amidase